MREGDKDDRADRCFDSDLCAFRNIVGEQWVVTEGPVLEDSSHDEMLRAPAAPGAVIFPASTSEVSRILEHASSRRLPVTPRGAGTGLCGGAVPERGGIVLCLSRMNRILEIDEENYTATVQPGVLLTTIHQTVESLGLFYSPDPGEKTATIGGNISTNAGGMRAIKYGVTRDNVRGIEVVLASGEILKLGGKHAKNSAGYSLLNLFTGSEGTLGVITEATLRLLPLPKHTLSLLVPFDSLDDATGAVPAVFATGIIPQSIEFAETGVIRAAEQYLGRSFPHHTAPAYLLLRIDGATSAQVQAEMEPIAEACLSAGAQDVLIADTRERQSAIWDARAAFLAALKSGNEVDECDVVVPRNKVAQLVAFSKAVSSDVGVRIESFGHAGDGNLHIYVLRDGMPKAEWEEKVVKAMDALYEKGFELGGLVSGEHGIGSAKRRYLGLSASKAELEAMARIKASFDPLGILNEGKIVSNPA